MAEYITTEEECRKQISGVCSGCGGELVPIETVDNAGRPTFWSGCPACSCFDSGRSPLAVSVATKLFDEGETAFSMERPSQNTRPDYADYYKRAQVRGLSRLVARILALTALQEPPK